MAEPEVQDNPAEQRFEVRLDGEVVGFLRYDDRGAAVLLTHTEVDERFEGRGLGSTLIREALDALRSRGVGVLPYCPFVRGYIQRHAEYVDLVPPERRERFDLPA